MAVDIPGYCTLCRSRCGTLNTVADGRLVKVAPLPAHPTGRAICTKGRAGPEIAHSSRRLTRPLRRTTPKGAPDPGWEPIGWDEALDEIATRLGAIRDAHGAEAVAFALTSPSATPMVDSVEWVERFIQLFGSPNVCNATEICNWQKDTGHALTFGANLPLPDYARTDFVVLWGHNPSAVWLAEAGELAEARKRGARLAVVDPRRTGHAAEADHWLAVRPGTDAALALGLAHLLIAGGTFDRDFVRQWTNGPLLVRSDDGRLLRWRDVEPGGADGEAFVVWDEAESRPRRFDPGADPRIAARTLALDGDHTVAGIACRPAFGLYAARCSAFPPARVEAVTGVPAAAVEALARDLATARAVSWYAWTGVGQHANSTATARAIGTLHALLGSFDAPGGNVVPTPLPAGLISDRTLLPPEQLAKALGAAVRPLGPAALGMVTARELYDAILEAKPYRVRALMTFGANLLLSRADAMRGKAALEALDFAVHCDLFDNPTARQADILLPVSSPWEREGLKLGFDVSDEAQEWVQLRPAMIPRLGESRSDAEIVCALAGRLGFADRMFGGDIEAGHAHRLAPLGLTPDELRRHPLGIRHQVATRHRKFAETVEGRVRGFATGTGRIELYSERLLSLGQPALPDHVPSVVTDGAGAFPFLLTCAKSPHFCQSQHRQIASLRRRSREPMVSIATDIARARAIRTGDPVAITTRTASTRFRAVVDAGLAAGVAVADFGWWSDMPDLALPGHDPFGDDGSNFNRLVDADDPDPVSGAPSLKSFACNVGKLAESRVAPWPGRRSLAVLSRRDHAGIVEIELADPDGRRLPPFLPGQHVTLSLETPGGTVERSYSLCGPGERDGCDRYRIAIRPIGPHGRFSGQSLDALRPGARIDARAPSGHFLLPVAADGPVVLLAAGIGITPFLGYLNALGQASCPPEIELHSGCRDGARQAFGDEIARLAAQLPTVSLITHFSQPSPADRPDRIGRIDADAVSQDLIDRRARFYLCGPGDMIATVTAGLVRRGVPAFEIFSERFVSPPASPVAAGNASFSVTFARSGRKATWSPGSGDLLAFSEGLGLDLPGGCRVGECESCALPVLAGSVVHRVAAAGPDEGICLACQAVPASDLVLDA